MLTKACRYSDESDTNPKRREKCSIPLSNALRIRSRPRNHSMFSCRGDSNTTRLFARAFLTLFVVTFFMASQPRMPEIFAHPLPDRESRILNLGDLLNVAIAGRGLKSGDFQNQSRLVAASISQSNLREKVVLRAADRSAVYSDPPTTGSFLIRSPLTIPLHSSHSIQKNLITASRFAAERCRLPILGAVLRLVVGIGGEKCWNYQPIQSLWRFSSLSLWGSLSGSEDNEVRGRKPCRRASLNSRRRERKVQ